MSEQDYLELLEESFSDYLKRYRNPESRSELLNRFSDSDLVRFYYYWFFLCDLKEGYYNDDY